MQTRIQIVEDEAITAEDLKEALEKMGYLVNEVAAHVAAAVELYRNHGADLFIVDITLRGDKTGLDLGRMIRDDFKKPFIFLTSHTDKQTMEKARDCSPGSYLVKPYRKEELMMAIELALQNYSIEKTGEKEQAAYLLNDSIFIKDGHSFIKIKEPEILFFKSDGVYIEVHTTGKTHLTRDSFRNVLSKLNTGKFLQVHKSYFVNLDHIQEVNSSFVKIKGQEIPVGKTHRDELFRVLGI